MEREGGSEFQSLGALTQKDRSPIVDSRNLGTDNGPSSDDLRDLVGRYGWIRSDRYRGARPFRALKVNRRTLK